ncbi:BON domain-containing protein [Nocardia huaxiensis]|uniref:BON domain-containing protein n=1 Tax=Nocardia huaxiensis TaxID=2755382 RepID=A0A7D6VFU4_9NOCA|nr:BON domain-containing protein [Nocardia huaxiensis]QLY34514.1 BON domain-containing protein [Nocardia huaxiensis]UFS99968.1 BON domain-containing protein [Nocardia huaxiensis]
MVRTIDRLLDTLTRVVNTLLDNRIPFAVGGGCAVYARGGPASDHDVDIFVKPADAAQARAVLANSGLRPVDPAEDWLTKVYDGETLVDLIFRPNYRTVTDELLGRASWMRIGPTAAPVVSGTDLMVDKLMVLDPHRLDFTKLLHIARDLREQVDWVRVREETEMSPYARAFLGLLDDLGISDDRRPDSMNGNPGDRSAEILPQYLVANLRRAFAEDPRTAELGVQVTLRGDVVVLSGEVASSARREQLETVVREQVPKLRVHNDIRVTPPDPPAAPEELR